MPALQLPAPPTAATPARSSVSAVAVLDAAIGVPGMRSALDIDPEVLARPVPPRPRRVAAPTPVERIVDEDEDAPRLTRAQLAAAVSSAAAFALFMLGSVQLAF